MGLPPLAHSASFVATLGGTTARREPASHCEYGADSRPFACSGSYRFSWTVTVQESMFAAVTSR
jgi:hypothetical protein